MGSERAYYTVLLDIGGKNYTQNLQKVVIAGSIWSVYHTICITFRIDGAQMVADQLYSQKSCRLTIVQTTESVTPQDQQVIDLIVVKVLSNFKGRPQDQEPMAMNRDPVTYICVPKIPYLAMTKLVNYIAPNTDPKSPFDAAKSIISSFVPELQLDIKDKNSNTSVCEQLVVPPMKLTKALDYLNGNFPIYKGPLFYQCNFLENKLTMCDIAKQIEEPELYTIYSISEGNTNKDSISKSGGDDKTFYTHSPLQTKYSGGQKVMKQSYKNRFIVYPSDALYGVIDLDAEQIFNENMPKDNGELMVPDELKQQMSVHTTNTLNSPDDDAFARASLAKNLSIMSEITVRLHRNLRLTPLFQIGVPVNIKPESVAYAQLQGKYIVKGSVITLSRRLQAHYTATADIHLFRSNPTI